MADRNGVKTTFGKKCQKTLYTLWVKNFVEIPLSHTVFEINAFFFVLCRHSR